MTTEHYPFVNPPLGYAYDALEPWIDATTMRAHHAGHLQGYTDRLNAALAAAPRLQGLSLEALLRRAPALPEPVRTAVLQNAGGVWNHRFYFDLLAPGGAREPIGPLGDALARGFGGAAAFYAAFERAALGVFGSGYAWLVADGGALRILTTANQAVPPADTRPVLTVDVWEHAYYLKHQYRRGNYLRDFFRAVNWTRAAAAYRRAVG